MTVRLSRLAELDLAEASDSLDQRSPEAAARLLARFEEAMQLLASGVVEGRPVELTDGRRVQAWLLNPYRIYYQREGAFLEVLRVYHSARRPIER